MDRTGAGRRAGRVLVGGVEGIPCAGLEVNRTVVGDTAVGGKVRSSGVVAGRAVVVDSMPCRKGVAGREGGPRPVAAPRVGFGVRRTGDVRSRVGFIIVAEPVLKPVYGNVGRVPGEGGRLPWDVFGFRNVRIVPYRVERARDGTVEEGDGTTGCLGTAGSRRAAGSRRMAVGAGVFVGGFVGIPLGRTGLHFDRQLSFGHRYRLFDRHMLDSRAPM